MAQFSTSQVDEDLNRAKEFFTQKDYESALRHLQLTKLTSNTPSEDVSLMEIQCLYSLKKYKPCSELIKYSLSSIDLSINSISIISTLELKIKQHNQKKDIEVAKLRMIDKIKSEPSGWDSFINSTKSSIKSLISN